MELENYSAFQLSLPNRIDHQWQYIRYREGIAGICPELDVVLGKRVDNSDGQTIKYNNAVEIMASLKGSAENKPGAQLAMMDTVLQLIEMNVRDLAQSVDYRSQKLPPLYGDIYSTAQTMCVDFIKIFECNRVIFSNEPDLLRERALVAFEAVTTLEDLPNSAVNTDKASFHFDDRFGRSSFSKVYQLLVEEITELAA